jgi:hypothetical protein
VSTSLSAASRLCSSAAPEMMIQQTAWITDSLLFIEVAFRIKTYWATNALTEMRAVQYKLQTEKQTFIF